MRQYQSTPQFKNGHIPPNMDIFPRQTRPSVIVLGKQGENMTKTRRQFIFIRVLLAVAFGLIVMTQMQIKEQTKELRRQNEQLEKLIGITQQLADAFRILPESHQLMQKKKEDSNTPRLKPLHTPH